MLAAGIETPMPMEELEIHVHEEIERQLKFGTERPNSLIEVAVKRSGNLKLSSVNSKELKVERIKIGAELQAY